MSSLNWVTSGYDVTTYQQRFSNESLCWLCCHIDKKEYKMKILRVKKTPLFDIFLGEGWTNHCRVYFKKGALSFVGVGVTLSNSEKATLKTMLVMENV